MKMNKEDIKDLIREVMSLTELTGQEMQEKEPDMNQAYINFIVAVMESARETIEEIERGTSPEKAAFDSRFKSLVQGFGNEEFYEYFYS